ncbi:MAG: helix-turn-helix domain-containing protein, partial [Chloroflexota bacterium]
MTIPIHQFNEQKSQDIPFEIVRLADISPISISPRPHKHTFYEICWVQTGTATQYLDFNPYKMNAHTITFVSPGQVKSWDTKTTLKGYVILFTKAFLQMTALAPVNMRDYDFFHRPDLQPLITLTPEAYTLFDQLCLSMVRDFEYIGLGRSTLLESWLRIFLVHAQRLFEAQRLTNTHTATSQLVESFMRAIDHEYARYQQVQDYADQLGITPNYLTDCVREQLGVSASTLIHQRIILESKRLLTYSDQPIGEIAFALNFDDPSYFSRYFKRHV